MPDKQSITTNENMMYGKNTIYFIRTSRSAKDKPLPTKLLLSSNKSVGVHNKRNDKLLCKMFCYIYLNSNFKLFMNFSFSYGNI